MMPCGTRKNRRFEAPRPRWHHAKKMARYNRELLEKYSTKAVAGYRLQVGDRFVYEGEIHTVSEVTGPKGRIKATITTNRGATISFRSRLSPVSKILDAESFEAEQKLKRESCCCGATKSNPCACMIQGVMKCDATCPCSLAKKGAESFSAEDDEETWTPCHHCDTKIGDGEIFYGYKGQTGGPTRCEAFCDEECKRDAGYGDTCCWRIAKGQKCDCGEPISGDESFSAEGERDFFKESGGECEWCKGVVRKEDGTATGDAWFCNACMGYTHPSKVRYLKGQPQEGGEAESWGGDCEGCGNSFDMYVKCDECGLCEECHQHLPTFLCSSESFSAEETIPIDTLNELLRNVNHPSHIIQARGGNPRYIVIDTHPQSMLSIHFAMNLQEAREVWKEMGGGIYANENVRVYKLPLEYTYPYLAAESFSADEENSNLSKKEVKMNLWYPLTVGFFGGTISTIVANMISIKWAKKNGHL